MHEHEKHTGTGHSKQNQPKADEHIKHERRLPDNRGPVRHRSLDRVVAVLVIACHHALGLAIPRVVAINAQLLRRIAL